MEDRSQRGEWVRMGSLEVARNPKARSRDEDPELKTWHEVVIMRVIPEVPFFLGFISVFSPIPVMYEAACTVKLTGARPGPEDVTFVAQAVKTNIPLKLILVRRTVIDDPDYADVSYI